jgi:agmatine deiminase
MANNPTALPRELGYRMPAEWEPHAATWLTWPRRDGISFPDRFDPIPAYWVRMTELLSQHETVHINTFDDEQEAGITDLLARSKELIRERVFLHRFPAYEPWCRDHGPIFVTRSPITPGAPGLRNLPSSPPTGREGWGEGGLSRAATAVDIRDTLAVVDWGYNAWGGKYPPFDLDDAVPQHVARLLGVPLFQPGIVLEGGSIDVNGRGTLLTTEACLLNPNRNPHLSRESIEQYLRDYLSVTKILWLDNGIAGDDTDGHIDDLARFVGPSTVVTAVEDDPADENYKSLQENLRRLRSMTDQDGRPLRIVTLPMPRPVYYKDQRLPACYANFYIANGIVLVPTFEDSTDTHALTTLQQLFSDRRVVGIPSLDLIWGLGAFHCVTQQQPKVD